MCMGESQRCIRYEQIVCATTNTKQKRKKRNYRKFDDRAYTDVAHAHGRSVIVHTHTHTHIQPRCQTMCSWLVRWMSRAWLLTNCRICFVSYGNWLRLYRKWRCKIRALTSRIAESRCLSAVVTTLRFCDFCHSDKRVFFSYFALLSFFLLLSRFDADTGFCVCAWHFTDEEKKVLNTNMVQWNTKSANVWKP